MGWTQETWGSNVHQRQHIPQNIPEYVAWRDQVQDQVLRWSLTQLRISNWTGSVLPMERGTKPTKSKLRIYTIFLSLKKKKIASQWD